MGAVSSLNSLMAVIAPVIGAPLLAMVSHLPPGDWRIGAPFYFCAVLQAARAAVRVAAFPRRARGRPSRRAPAAAGSSASPSTPLTRCTTRS